MQKRLEDKLDKPRFSKLPWRELTQVARVQAFGAKKYSWDEWKKQQYKDVFIDPALRHIAETIEGVTEDPESGEHPLAHAICSLLYALWHINENKINGKERPEWTAP